MPTTNHTTTPTESGTFHLWEVGDERGAVTLSALHCHSPGLVSLVNAVPSVASLVTFTDAGAWVFDVLQSHNPHSVGWAPCQRHGACDVDAFVTGYAQRVWDRLTAVRVTNTAVFAELRQVFADEFKGQAA